MLSLMPKSICTAVKFQQSFTKFKPTPKPSVKEAIPHPQNENARDLQ